MSPTATAPATSRIHVRQFTTTTIFADPTSLGSHVDPRTPVPVAAIAGGACGGVILAVLAVIGWKWWGRQIKEKERRELEKRKAMAYRQAQARSGRSSSSTSRASSRSPSGSGSGSRSGTRSRRTSSDSKAPSDRMLKLAGTGPPLSSPSPIPPVPPLPPLDSISSPRPLKPRSPPAEKPLLAADCAAESVTPFGRSRADSRSSRSYRPLRPSPLALASPSKPSYSPRSPDLSPTEQSVHAPKTPVTLTASAMTATSQQVPSSSSSSSPPPPPAPPPSSFSRLPRVKASLSSLTGEARRQSKASSRNSASDQSRHSSAGGSARRWSWWSLINGRGFRQVGPTTGKNRISADTSVLYSDWQEEDPSAPIGYAYSGVDNDDKEEHTGERTLTQ